MAGGARARHVAIVSDGSARWAEANGRSVAQGHEAAADTVLARVSDALDLGIEQLTLFAFSTENWTRPAGEVRDLFEMLARRVRSDAPLLARRGITVRFLGRRDRLGSSLQSAIAVAEVLPVSTVRMRVFVAVDYGGRDEIVRAAGCYRGGGEQELGRLLRPHGLLDPDLVIRTSGERRLSNFMLWHAAYAELIFREELWPDFDRAALEECLAEFSERLRRFGGRAGTARDEPTRLAVEAK